MNKLIPIATIERRIFLLRKQKIMLDADLAALYGVTTKALNQAVKRNPDRFPEDFMFQLTKNEKEEVVTNCDHLMCPCQFCTQCVRFWEYLIKVPHIP